MQFNDSREGNVYNVWLQANTLSSGGPNDIYALLTSSGSRIQILDVRLGQASTNPAAIQSLGVQFFSGTTSTAPAGTALTPFNTKRWAGAPTAVTSVTGPTTTLSTTTSATLIYADAFDAASGSFRYKPREDYGVPIVITNSQRFHIRVTQPSSIPVILHGTLTFKEIGFGLPA
jgi:hypothetical protein